MKLTFVGGGNMAAALIGGLLAKGTAPDAIKVVEVLPEARARLHAQTGVSVFASAAEAKPYGDVVVLAVKPQHMRQVARELAPHLSGELVVSIAAGIRLADLDRWLEHRVRLVRCMPNTPALIGHGIAGLYAGSDVTSVDRVAAQTVVEAVGRAVWVDDEALLDPVTAVSGSGPA